MRARSVSRSIWPSQAEVAALGGGQGRDAQLGRRVGADRPPPPARRVRVVAYDVEDKGAAAGAPREGPVPTSSPPGPGLPFVGGVRCRAQQRRPRARGRRACRPGGAPRILRPGGRLFTYHLPNRHAYTEWIGRRLGQFHHERTYTRREACALFERAGFRVEGCRPFHMLPRNVWGRVSRKVPMAPWTGAAYDRLDAAVVRIPGIRPWQPPGPWSPTDRPRIGVRPGRPAT